MKGIYVSFFTFELSFLSSILIIFFFIVVPMAVLVVLKFEDVVGS